MGLASPSLSTPSRYQPIAMTVLQQAPNLLQDAKTSAPSLLMAP